MAVPDNQKRDGRKWDSLWLNANLVTMAEEKGYGIITDSAIGISDGRIAWLGKMSGLNPPVATLAQEVHDAGGAWLTPGLVDCHTHLVYAGNRAEEFEQRAQGKTYAEIAQAGGGILSTVRATRLASEEELLAQSEKRLRALLREGVTTIEIKSGYGLNLDTERKMLRVARALGQKYPVTVKTTFLGAHALPTEFGGRADAYLEYVCQEILPVIAAENLADAVDGFCETIGFTPAQVARLFEAARQWNLPIKLHAEQLSDQGGAALAARYHALSADHLEHANKEGIAAMAGAGTVAVLLPGAFYMLRETRKPPLDALRRYRVPIALATDCNPGTSPITSLLTIMNMGVTLFGLTPEEALRGVTKHGAMALGLGKETGTLEPGKAADIAIWDIAHPRELSYHIGYNPCRGVIQNGIFRDTGNQ